MSKALALAVVLPALLSACGEDFSTSSTNMTLTNSDSTPYSVGGVELGWPVDYVKSVYMPGDCKPLRSGTVECSRYSFSENEGIAMVRISERKRLNLAGGCLERALLDDRYLSWRRSLKTLC